PPALLGPLGDRPERPRRLRGPRQMAMNREQKRAAQRQGLAGPDGAPITTRERPRPQQRLKEERVSPRQFISEVTSELKKTSWPTRQETIRLAIIVFIA